jgi:restriction system protein
MNMPTFDQLMEPTVKVLEGLGGSGGIEEIAAGVIQFLTLPEEITSQLHNPEKSSRTEVEYRLAWTRTFLKQYGILDNSERGVWSFTSKYVPGQPIKPQEITRFVRDHQNEKKVNKEKGKKNKIAQTSLELEEEVEAPWRELLHQQLLGLKSDAFERLAMRLLRESGFVQLEVTGRSGDGGIDGKGIIKLQGVLSYHVVFQCKRYKESVGAGAIRDFRGAMIGRADKGLFITTGTFTRDAIKEATRDGASPIDMIDGENLVDMLKNLKLGVKVRMIEEVEVDKEWFDGI